MALLDSTFSGEQSITALLANMFAGNAVVIYRNENITHDPITDAYTQENDTKCHVKFIQESLKRNVLTHVDGVQIEAGDLVGVIPGYQIEKPIRKQLDMLQRNGENYRIISTEDIYSGDERAIVLILCKIM